MIKKVICDICIMGGGITGLWALNRLKQLGYSVLLFENQALGSGQTIHSQGIIHGGLKYALNGLLTNSSNNIESMPERWKSCLQGKGEIDLSEVHTLSNDQLLWSTGSLTSDLTTFFASKTLSSRIKKVAKENYPKVLQNPAFKGCVYRLEEIVLDVPSLIKVLAEKHLNAIYTYDNVKNANNNSITLETKNEIFEISAACFLFAAGEGNAKLLEIFDHKFKNDFSNKQSSSIKQSYSMQTRPLHMIYITFSELYSSEFALFGHCIEKGNNPRITITSHKTKEGKCVWYIGGQIAEDGINRSASEQILTAKKELQTIFPWLNFDQVKFSSFMINRAESLQKNGKRPDSFSLEQFNNIFIAWPTKLALAPLLCDQLIQTISEQNLKSKINTSDLNNNKEILALFNPPKISKAPWD